MPAIPAERATRVAPVFALAAALIVLRASVWVFFEQSHFDSDQAIVGLMAKHLAEGRAVPLFFYGQHYMLAVEAWLAAPLFAVAGASVTALKLPLLAINIAIAWLLIKILREELSLAPWAALAASIFFILPPPLAAARLVEAQGSNIEPLLYVLILWKLRERPLVFGALAGFAFLHREFVIYAVVAVALLDLAGGRLRSPDRRREYLMAWGMAALVIAVVNVLKTRADLLGPGSAGTLGTPAAAWGGLVCWSPADISGNIAWLFRENLGTIFNWKRDVLGPQGWAAIPVGHVWIWPLLVTLAGLAGSLIPASRNSSDSKWQFPAYLGLIGIQAAAAYVALGCHVQDGSLIRYTLLTLFAPVAISGWVLAASPSRSIRAAALALIVIWGAASLFDNTRYLVAYVKHPAPAPYRELADFLESNGVRYGRAYYWTAYQLDFLSRERLTIASLDKVRVAEYQQAADQHEAQVVRIKGLGECMPPSVSFRRWCFEELDRARGAAPAR